MLNVDEQRIFHVTHVSNLADILASGSLLADAHSDLDPRPALDASSPDTREARRSATIAGAPDAASVADFVPFFLAPAASIWQGVITGDEDPRISAAARAAASADYVILVSTISKVSAAEATVVISDGDAADSRTRFGVARDDLERTLRRLHVDAEPSPLLTAELLVHESVPLERITLVGVANDRARDVVRGILAASTFTPKVAVYPPWFRKVEDAPQPEA